MNVWSVVYLSKVKKVEKKPGTVQGVKEKKPAKKTEPTLKLPSQAEIMKNPMKYIGQAVQIFQNLALQVEQQGKAIVAIAKHVESSDEKLAPIVTALEQAQAARAQATTTPVGADPTPQGLGGSQLLPVILQAIAGGGGGSNPMQERMFNAMFEKTMMGMDLSNALTKAMIIKLAPELANTLTATLIKKKE